jgi:copper homeostasis protein
MIFLLQTYKGIVVSHIPFEQNMSSIISLNLSVQKSKMLFEACVNSAISSIEAQKGGADRVELCENMADGGCTPGAGTIRFARKHLHIPLMVMIRPRGADFLYSSDEFEIMKEDIAIAKESGADGVVFGILKPDGTFDTGRMEELVRLVHPMDITCHRAFDMTRDPFEALEDLISLGIPRVLTSGQADSALDGAPLIRELIRRAEGRIIVMPGHGIKEHNLAEVIRATGAEEFHMYLTRQIASNMSFRRDRVAMGHNSDSEYEYPVVDAERIRRAKDLLTRFE